LGKGVFEVLVDTDTSKENISRLASQSGWSVEVKRTGDEFYLLLKRE
jgi:TusA-related sulfurtransferase